MTLQNKNTSLWIAQVAKEFFLVWKELLTSIDSKVSVKSIGHDFYLLEISNSVTLEHLNSTVFSRYWMFVNNMWPTKTEEKGFIEKCAKGLLAKFLENDIDNIIVFSLDRKKQALASNLRGRLLQVFESKITQKNSKKQLIEWSRKPSTQPVTNKTLVVALAEKCIYSSLGQLKDVGSYFGGGRRYVGVSGQDVHSRAAGKWIEAMEFLSLKQIKCSSFQKWLELGAAPGGITQEMVSRNLEVWAVDNADLEAPLQKNPLVHFYKMDAREFKTQVKFDAQMCDLNGPSYLSAQMSSSLTKHLKKGGIVIHTLKIHDVADFHDEVQFLKQKFHENNCSFLYARHLYNNKKEVTLFFKKV